MVQSLEIDSRKSYTHIHRAFPHASFTELAAASLISYNLDSFKRAALIICACIILIVSREMAPELLVFFVRQK